MYKWRQVLFFSMLGWLPYGDIKMKKLPGLCQVAFSFF
jgi:hypothetical protein